MSFLKLGSSYLQTIDAPSLSHGGRAGRSGGGELPEHGVSAGELALLGRFICVTQ